MRKLSIPILLMIIALIVAGCSKKEELQEIYDNKPSIRGIVKEIEDDTILIESRDRAQAGDIRVSTDVELKGGLVDFKVGDLIIVYYDGTIMESSPAQINEVYAFKLGKKNEIEDEVDSDNEEGIGFNDVDFYDFPKLSVVHNDKSKDLTDNNSAFIHDLINSVDWEQDSIDNFKYDYMIMDEFDVFVTFDSKTHTLNDTKNDISIVLPENLSKALKRILDS